MTEAELDRHKQVLMDNDDAANAPPGRVLVWADRPPDKRPYKTPYEEYCKSKHVLSADVLKKRWAGMVDPAEIDEIFEKPFLIVERQRARSLMMREIVDFDVDDPKFKASMNAYDLLSVRHEIDALTEIIESGVVNDALIERWTEKDENDKSLHKRRYVDGFRPLKVAERVLLEQVRDEKRKLSRLLVDEATEIKKVDVDVNVTVLGQMKSALGEINPEFARMKAIAEGKSAESLSPVPATGRVIDAEGAFG